MTLMLPVYSLRVKRYARGKQIDPSWQRLYLTIEIA
jgi:hypothetical protein